jgi:hypothetical protein
MTVHCAGLTCDKIVEREGQFCGSCWPSGPTTVQFSVNPIMPLAKTIPQLRLDLFRAAYQLNFGNRAERKAALPEIAHLTFVLQNMKEE